MEIKLALFALAPLLWASLVYEEQLAIHAKRVFDPSKETIQELEWRKEFVLHAAFYGSVVAAVLGFAHESLFTKLIAGLWFVSGLAYSRKLTKFIEAKEAHEDWEHRRKVAGMVRSVVRSELAASKRDDGGRT